MADTNINAIADALKALRDEDGLLRIEKVVEAATAPASPLHDHFEWNDGEAARRFRLHQARTLRRGMDLLLGCGLVLGKRKYAVEGK